MTNGKVSTKPKVYRGRRTTSPIRAAGIRKGGATAPYPDEIRVTALQLKQAGGLDEPGILAARAQGQFPHDRSIQRYEQRRRDQGHSQPYKRNGNKPSDKLRGIDLVALALFVQAFPTATGSEKQVFLFNCTGRHRPVPYIMSEKQITEAEQAIGISRKRTAVSTIAGFSHRCLSWREAFWTQHYPFGAQGIPRSCMIDIDEAIIEVAKCNRRFAKCSIHRKEARVAGFGREDGILCLAAISGDNNGFRLCKLYDRSGTTLPIFVEFIQDILAAIGPGTPGNRRCFMMDNLNVHHHPIVLMLILNAGHHFIFRAPYWPKDGPIEYFFNALEGNMRTYMFEMAGRDELIDKILDYFNEVLHFCNYFVHVGFN